MTRGSPLLFLFLLPLASCSRNEGDRGYMATAAAVSEPSDAKARRGAEPIIKTVLAAPPSAGPLGPVSEKIYADGWRQSLSLDRRKYAGGWNDLAIDIRFEGSTRGGAKIPIGPPSKDGINKEMAARFEGVTMRVVRRPFSNALGPYGLAVGASGDLRCVFAWQWLDDLPGGDWRGKRSASIRMRLCRPKVTVDELAAVFDGVQLGDPSSIATITATWKEAPDSAFVGVEPQAKPVADTPLEAELAANKPASLQKSTTVRPRHCRRPAARAQQPISSPSTVPQTARRFLAPTGAATPAVEPRNASVAPLPIQSALDTSLPAQAYRGPGSAQPQKAP